MRSKVFIFSLLLFLVAISLWGFKSQSRMLSNVEALAAGEGTVPIYCLGVGSVDCPMGGKVRKVVIGYSLE